MIRLIVRLSVRAVVLVLVGGWVVVAASSPVQADAPCLSAVGSISSAVVDEASIAVGGSALLQVPLASPYSTPTVGSGPVLTAGAAAAGGTPAGLAALLIGGAAYSGGGAGCFFVDVLNADKLVADGWCAATSWFCGESPPTEPLVGHGGVTYGGLAGGLSGPIGTTSWATCTYLATSPGFCFGRSYSLTFSGPAASGGYGSAGGLLYQLVGPGRGMSRGGVSIPEKPVGPYELPVDPLYDSAWRNKESQFGRVCGLWSFTTTCSAGATDVDRSSVVMRMTCAFMLDHDNSVGTASVITENVGGHCGQIPGTVLVSASPTNESAPFGLVAPWYPAVNETGWSRQYVTDSWCFDLVSEVTTIRRYDGALFYDKGTTAARPSVARCQTGEVATETLITKVPANVECMFGVVCWPGSEVARVTLPTEVIEAVGPCLAVGNGCYPAPVLIENDAGPEDDECEWEPSVTIDLTYCTATPVPVGVTPDSDLETGEVVDVGAVPAGEPTSTGTPVPVLDIITDPAAPPTPPEVTTGIDTGTDAPVCQGAALTAGELLLSNGWTIAQVVAQIGCTPDADSGECFPDGWGLFNPVEWVVKPVKCVLVWAFVPSDEDSEAFVNSVRTSVEGTFPLSLFVVVIDLADAFADSAAASATSCIDLDMTVAGVDPGCMSIPSNMLTPAQMTVIRTGLVCSLVLAVAWASIRLVSG